MAVHDGLHGAYLQRVLVARIGRYGVDAELRSGRLCRLWSGVLVDADRVLDVTTRATAAVLLHGERSVVSGPTAASLYGCTAMEVPATHVLVPYGHCLRSRPGLSVHNGPLTPDDVIELSGLPVLTVERLLGDLLCTVRPRDALATADQLLAAQPVDRREQLRARVAQRLADRRDQRGTRRGMRLLGLATGRAESPPESWLLLEVVDLGFPSPEVNWSVSAPDGTQLYRLDLAWPDLRIALEYDGYAVHAGRQTEDARRAADLRRRGWIVLTATIDDLRDSRRLEGVLAAAFAQRGYRRSR